MPLYKKIRLIGSGSFGKAYLVKEKDDDKELVMKAIDMSQMDIKTREDTLNEAKVLSSLDPHPFIIRYYQSYIHDNQLCIIMDYAQGGDIYAKIQEAKKDNKRIDEKMILRWFTQALLALKYLHERHILHRDLKPQNMFLNAKGDIRVGDFGISKVLESTIACAQTTIGTPYYLSPELCKSEKYSFPSDIWALGCILFELTSLRVPFSGNNLNALVQSISDDPVPSIPSGYSDDLNHLVSDLLTRDPKKRPAVTDILRRDIIQNEISQMMKEQTERK